MEMNNNQNTPSLMSEEYCMTPHFLASYEETKATRRAMAKRCVEGGREVIFIKYIGMDQIRVIGPGKEEAYMPWKSPKGMHLHFEAEAKDPKSGAWEKKVFDLTTAERSASIDAGIVIEGTDSDGKLYTISSFDFSDELHMELKKRGMLPKKSAAEAKEKARLAREKREAFEREQEELNQQAVKEAMDEVLGLNQGSDCDMDSSGFGFGEFDDSSDRYDDGNPEIIYHDPEYGDIYYWK